MERCVTDAAMWSWRPKLMFYLFPRSYTTDIGTKQSLSLNGVLEVKEKKAKTPMILGEGRIGTKPKEPLACI